MPVLRAPLPIGAIFTYVKLEERWRYAFHNIVRPRRARILYTARRRLSQLYTAIVRHGQVAAWRALTLGSPLGWVAKAISNAVNWVKHATATVARTAQRALFGATATVARAAQRAVVSVGKAIYSYSERYVQFWRATARSAGATGRKVVRAIRSFMIRAGNAIHRAVAGAVAGASSIARNVKAFCNKVKQGVTNTFAGAKRAFDNWLHGAGQALRAAGAWLSTWGPFIGALIFMGLLGYLLHGAKGVLL